MKIYVKCMRNGAPWYVVYQGQEHNAIEKQLEDIGCTDIAFIDEEVYLAATLIKPR